MTEQARGFFSSLFDLSFEHFVTPRIIRTVYLLAIVLSGLAALTLALAAFSLSPVLGAFVLVVLAPVLWLWSVIWIRVGLELAMAVFAIADHTRPARPSVPPSPTNL